jgi:hypothetical protein
MSFNCSYLHHGEVDKIDLSICGPVFWFNIHCMGKNKTSLNVFCHIVVVIFLYNWQFSACCEHLKEITSAF